MDRESLFYALLRAEDERDVTEILRQAGLLDEAHWLPLGVMENNFSIVGNQQTDPTAALVEKVINGIDAELMLEAFRHAIDPEGPDAPIGMSQAVERFLNIKDGRLENLTSTERTALARRVQLVAVGSKEEPCYLIVDQGEGQTPRSFPDTFLSLGRSNKIRIPFVQGRFNAGGTGVLQFCGSQNYQLIASRRDPDAPREPDDATANLWGFTLVRRLLPSGGRRNSMYVYVAPDGRVPTFDVPAVQVLPEEGKGSAPAAPYKVDLCSGTVIKLYNYRWKGHSIATTDARFELERLLHAPCLPFRVVETRPYRANYFAATVSGVWVRVREAAGDEDSDDLEDGFPAYGHVDIPEVGQLPYGIVVFRERVDTRRIPNGVFFTLNGQVHGGLPRDFVSREVKLDYLAKHILVSVDCTQMDERVREDFFMASRDRLRRNEVYETIGDTVRALLAEHPGLRELNARRRAKKLEEALKDDKGSMEAFQDLIRSDPSLRALFGGGERLTTTVGPTKEPVKYKGRKFPTFFRIAKEPATGLVKVCPQNWKCRVDLETDAENDYFDRTDSAGEMTVTPDGVLASRSLWNGQCITYFRPPDGAEPGGDIHVRIAVTDVERETAGSPFVNEFTLRVVEHKPHTPGGGESDKDKDKDRGTATAPRLAMPNIIEIRREQWADHDMGPLDAIRIKRAGEETEGYDFYVNMDNAFLITEMRRNKATERPILEFWFKFGLALLAVSMLKMPDIEHRNQDDVSVETIENLVAGLARVIIPVVWRLHEGPRAAQPDPVAAASE